MTFSFIFSGQSREARNAKDLEILNQHADELNREAADVLTYTARRRKSRRSARASMPKLRKGAG